MSIPPKFCDLSFPAFASRWDEAIPIGNGKLGALVWGSASRLVFSLSRTDLWDVTPFAGVSCPEFTYANMVRLAREGSICDIRRIFDTPYYAPTPCKLPAGRIVLRLSDAEHTASTLHLETAEAALSAGATKLDCFIHAQENLGLVRLNLPSALFDVTIENPAYGAPEEEPGAPGTLKSLRYPKAETYSDRHTRCFIQIAGDMTYGVFVRLKETTEGTLLAFTAASSADGSDWRAKAIARLESALDQGYDALFLTHRRWWRSFWKKSELHLPDRAFEKNWYLTNYFLACCSRKGEYPMALQGVWTADDGFLPPWKGDYHHDLNTQLCYSSYLTANHLDEGACFLDYLWKMAGCARDFARSFYDADGLCLPAVMSIDGQALGGWGMYALSPTNQIWLAWLFDRHYRVTGSKRFLKTRAYPYLKETAQCIMSLLQQRDGMLYLPISSSPEIHDDGIEAFLTPNSNYDLSLMRWLFRRLSQLAPLVGEGADQWQRIYDALPELSVNDDGVLLLSPDEAIEESHRHHSQLMAIYPLQTLDPDESADRRVIDASLLDLERRGTGLWCGYSFAWAASLYAMQRNGNAAYRMLELFWHDFCSPNGFHLNGDYQGFGSSSLHYRPFTLEGNFAAADALQQMLLQSRDGVLSLFPALPAAWQNQVLRFRRFRAEGGVIVSANYDGGAVTALTIAGAKEARIRCTEELTPLADRFGWTQENGVYLVPRGSYKK